MICGNIFKFLDSKGLIYKGGIMSKYYLITMFCASLLMSGCDHYSTKMAAMEQSNSDVSSIAPASGGEMTFSGYLASQYLQLAEYEQNVTHDYPAAKNYFTKFESLSNGKMVALDKIDSYKLNDKDKADLIAAHQQIEEALKEDAIPENRYPLAVAHSRYDCWLDEAAEGKENSSCKAQFKQAMSSLVIPNIDNTYNEFLDLVL